MLGHRPQRGGALLLAQRGHCGQQLPVGSLQGAAGGFDTPRRGQDLIPPEGDQVALLHRATSLFDGLGGRQRLGEASRLEQRPPPQSLQHRGHVVHAQAAGGILHPLDALQRRLGGALRQVEHRQRPLQVHRQPVVTGAVHDLQALFELPAGPDRVAAAGVDAGQHIEAVRLAGAVPDLTRVGECLLDLPPGAGVVAEDEMPDRGEVGQHLGLATAVADGTEGGCRLSVESHRFAHAVAEVELRGEVGQVEGLAVPVPDLAADLQRPAVGMLAARRVTPLHQQGGEQPQRLRLPAAVLDLLIPLQGQRQLRGGRLILLQLAQTSSQRGAGVGFSAGILVTGSGRLFQERQRLAGTAGPAERGAQRHEQAPVQTRVGGSEVVQRRGGDGFGLVEAVGHGE